MRQDAYFGDAKWVGVSQSTASTFFVLRGCFTVRTARRALLHAVGLGFFRCYINGVCINPDSFLPLSSDYEAGCDPAGEVLSGHRLYVPHFDISHLIHPGENSIALHVGGGWYTSPWRPFGLPKAIYRVTVWEEEGPAYFCSGEECAVGDSFVSDYAFTTHETHDYRGFADCLAADFDDSGWARATLAQPVDTVYDETDCPADVLAETITPVPIGTGEHGVIYDCGKNMTGYPVIALPAGLQEEVTLLFSEAALPSGELDLSHHHGQRFTVTGDGQARTVQPLFTWFGFRYFAVRGSARPVSVKLVHADVPVTSTFESDNETLNWIYKTFLHTMHCNMHTGHPSDCPHLERRGYTGDGQLTCHAVLTTMGARAFYEKWLQDIADSQDSVSGHIQYTAPYIRSGGGPGGWGCAIVEVPYQLYRHYGDVAVLEKYYNSMRRYIDYLEAHSEFGLVTSDKAGEWCLGGWCGPNILYPEKDITSHNQQVMLPAPMVNTYFMVKSLDTMGEIAQILGKEEDVAVYQEKAAMRKRAITAAYFNTFDGNFIMNVQGANAYALDLQLGDDTTYPNMVRYYQKLGYYDTGIFATDILTRVLFERGDGELAVDLLTGKGKQGFARWKENGATTFHEYWDSNRSRSHNHPMFGAPVAYLFEYLLGIRQKPHTAGYRSLLIAPQAVSRFGRMAGSMQVPGGTLAVAYEKQGERVCFRVTLPPATEAVFRYGGKDYPLAEGENILTL